MQVLSEKLKSGLFTSMLAEHEIKSTLAFTARYK